MDFSNIARQLKEGMESTEAAMSSAEKAKVGGEKQINDTARRKDRQKAQMAQQGSTPVKSDVSYASEEARLERERVSSIENNKSDWRTELYEAAQPDEQGNHPYVDVMPFMNQKAEEAKRQMKDVAKAQGMKQAKLANEGASNPFQVHFDKDGKSYTSKGSKKDAERIARNRKANFGKGGAMYKDPYKSRAGESD